MSFRVAWSAAALRVFYRLHIHSATLVDRTVIRFAETGEGELAWEPPYYHLRAGKFDVLMTIDGDAELVAVLHIYRTR